MARTGRFGRLPQAAPDLTSTIVSLYQQYESQRDQNILDAWRNGGDFEGKPVTDQRLMEWYGMRMGQTDEADPMHDYWKDQRFQLMFNVAESKANLHYTQGKLDEWDMAHFYRHWAGRLPVASQAWRTVMTQSARFAKAAKAKGAASNAAARAAEEQRRLDLVQKNRVDPAYNSMWSLWGAASAGGILATSGIGTGQFEYSPSDFAFNITDAQRFNQFITGLPESDPTLYAQISEELKKADPAWDGKLDWAHIEDMIQRGVDGLNRQGQIADHYNPGSGKTYRDRARGMHDTLTRIRVIGADLPDLYLNAREHRDEQLANARSPGERAQIYSDYGDALDGLAHQYGIMGDLGNAGKLRNEAEACRGNPDVGGTPTSFEDWAGRSGGVMSGTGLTDREKGTGAAGDQTDAQAISLDVQKSQKDSQDLASGKSVVIITSDTQGNQVQQVVPASSAPGLLGTPRTTSVQQAYGGSSFKDANGKTIAVPPGLYTQVVKRIPVIVQVPGGPFGSTGAPVDPNSGQPLPVQPGSPMTQQLGWYDDFGNGQGMYVVQTKDANGNDVLVSTSIPPFIDTPGTIADITKDGKSITVTYDTDWVNSLTDPTTKLNPIVSAWTVANDPKDPSNTKSYPTLTPQGLLNPKLTELGRGGDQVAIPPWMTMEEATRAFGESAVQRSMGVGQPAPPGLPPEPDVTGMGGNPPQGNEAVAPGYVGQQRTSQVSSHPGWALRGSRWVPEDQTPLTPAERAWLAEGSRPVGAPSVQAPRAANWMGVPGASPTGAQAATPVNRVPIGAHAAQEVATAPPPTVDPNTFFYSMLATHPSELGWANPTLAQAASTEFTRNQWGAVDPITLVKNLEEHDPLMKSDPAYRARVLGEVDVIRRSGSAGLTEADFSRQRMMDKAGNNPFEIAIANMMWAKTTETALHTPAVSALLSGQPIRSAWNAPAPTAPSPIAPAAGQPTATQQSIGPAIKPPGFAPASAPGVPTAAQTPQDVRLGAGVLPGAPQPAGAPLAPPAGVTTPINPMAAPKPPAPLPAPKPTPPPPDIKLPVPPPLPPPPKPPDPYRPKPV